MADFEQDSNQQLSVTAGSKVIVISKDESGKMAYNESGMTKEVVWFSQQ